MSVDGVDGVEGPWIAGAMSWTIRGVPDIEVRPYRLQDRDAVRRICFATGFMGDPCDWYWRDLASFADIWTGYYTDREPESLFVAVDGHDRVVGYVTGCVDSSSAPSPRVAVTRAMRARWLLFRPGTAGFFWRSIVDTVRDRGIPETEVADARYPSHLHINLLPEARGRGAGGRLVRALFDHLGERGSPGVHLGTMGENADGIAFFEAVGFTRHGPPVIVPGLRSRTGARMHTQSMVRPL